MKTGIVESKKYVSAPVNTGLNLFIGGMAATIPDAATLASRINILESDISSFIKTGNDIEARVEVNFTLDFQEFLNNTSITHFRVLEGKLVNSGGQTFSGSTIEHAVLEGTTILENSFTNTKRLRELAVNEVTTFTVTGSFQGSKLNCLELPSLTSIGNAVFSGSEFEIYYLPHANLLLGSTTGRDGVFDYVKAGAKIYVHPNLETVNGGAPDGDLAHAVSLGAEVIYIRNSTKPSAITDLVAESTFATSVKLNFTAPTSTNGITFYEVRVNGRFNSRATDNNNVYAEGLKANTTYTITVKAIDGYYNKSVESNSIQVTTASTATVPTSDLVSYYKLDTTTPTDSYGTNNGTNGGVAVTTGKQGPGYNFTGTAAVDLGNPAAFQLATGAIALWVKSSNFGSGYRGLMSKDGAYGLLLSGNILGTYSWGGAAGFRTTGINIADGQWHFIVLNFASGVANGTEIWLDGQLVLTTTVTGNTQANNLWIGQNAASQRMTAIGDEVPIYNNKINRRKILELYNNGIGAPL